MSKIVLDEQTNPGVQGAGQQAIYPLSSANSPPNGALARTDVNGVQAVILDSRSYAAAVSTAQLYINNGGV